MASPWWATSEAAPRIIAASQCGSPRSMPVIMSLAACDARSLGASARYAWLSQNASHSAFAARAPDRPPRDEGRRCSRPFGQSSTAISA